MRVAVVTPYYNETDQQLERCIESVVDQSYRDVTHVMVADGLPREWQPTGRQFEHIMLPHSHADAGATPRSIGALSAFSREFDAVAFLDADNWYEPNHIELMVNKLSETNVDAVAATRTIYGTDGSCLYVDRIESNVSNMVDTNCMFLSRRTMYFLPFWITPPSHRLVSDRFFWESATINGMKIARCDTPTVSYVTKWAWHYQYAGVFIPDDSVWMEQDAQGNYRQIKNKDWSKKT
jgi:glycosyltransferase involved in cell wall biosynthesis